MATRAEAAKLLKDMERPKTAKDWLIVAHLRVLNADPRLEVVEAYQEALRCDASNSGAWLRVSELLLSNYAPQIDVPIVVEGEKHWGTDCVRRAVEADCRNYDAWEKLYRLCKSGKWDPATSSPFTIYIDGVKTKCSIQHMFLFSQELDPTIPFPAPTARPRASASPFHELKAEAEASLANIGIAKRRSATLAADGITDIGSWRYWLQLGKTLHTSQLKSIVHGTRTLTADQCFLIAVELLSIEKNYQGAGLDDAPASANGSPTSSSPTKQVVELPPFLAIDDSMALGVRHVLKTVISTLPPEGELWMALAGLLGGTRTMMYKNKSYTRAFCVATALTYDGRLKPFVFRIASSDSSQPPSGHNESPKIEISLLKNYKKSAESWVQAGSTLGYDGCVLASQTLYRKTGCAVQALKLDGNCLEAWDALLSVAEDPNFHSSSATLRFCEMYGVPVTKLHVLRRVVECDVRKNVLNDQLPEASAYFKKLETAQELSMGQRCDVCDAVFLTVPDTSSTWRPVPKLSRIPQDPYRMTLNGQMVFDDYIP